MKRVLTIQDVSCFGKCSLTVALPLLSAMGSETVILPTAMLSTHTKFQNFTWKDLSDQIIPITDHWKSQGITFDAIYTGYLGTEEEIETVKKVIAEFRTEDTLVFVDPAMGDDGKLYTGFDKKYAAKNAELVAVADVAVPNITEAAFMTGMEYKEEYDEAYVRELLARLSALGVKIAAITGVSLQENHTGFMGYDAEKKAYFSYQHERQPRNYHGTGDVFSSVAVGGLMRGLGIEKAMQIAALYTAHTIEVTSRNRTEAWYGVDFEETIPELLQMVTKETK